MRLVAGIGCKRHATLADIEDALDGALSTSGLQLVALTALATSVEKAAEPAILSLAAKLGLPLMPIDLADMQSQTPGALSRSARVQSLKGVPSVAETAALAAAGPAARLLAPRCANKQATCAIARSDVP